MRRLALTRRKVVFLTGGAAAIASVALLANHSVARPAGNSAAAVCKTSTYNANQPIVIAKVDASASTKNAALRAQYADALDAVVAAAAAEGAYLIVDTFGSNPAATKTLCATSTRIEGAAPLFVTARTTELRRVLDGIARRASNSNDGASGSAIFGALVDAVQEVGDLRSDRRVPASIVVVTDGDEASKQTHLRLLLESGASNDTIVARVVGKVPSPDARRISIQMEGIGRAGNGPPISTMEARRMVQIWGRICRETRSARCSVSTDLIRTLTFGR